MTKMKERWAELEQAAKSATPGPWEQRNGFLKGSDGSDVVAAGLGIGLGRDNGNGVRTANGKWVKAANPAAIMELLEVTKGLAEALHCFHRDYLAVHDVGDVEMQPAIYQARAALAKYEGAQSALTKDQP